MQLNNRIFESRQSDCKDESESQRCHLADGICKSTADERVHGDI
uniref:Uncharacterized protein n=1 Tax=Parascaris univalens TaxID=6257 RepID=A0A915BBW3_PARUN